ncbi:MAG: transposase domain-containing protein [Rhodospirillales bacterium]|nr:MAG: transposase domain-containing protein [Rhodospirillales bacterium]
MGRLNRVDAASRSPALISGIDAQGGLADTLHRIVDHPASKLADLLPRNWPPQAADSMGAAA